MGVEGWEVRRVGLKIDFPQSLGNSKKEDIFIAFLSKPLMSSFTESLMLDSGIEEYDGSVKIFKTDVDRLPSFPDHRLQQKSEHHQYPGLETCR